jgi:hypothetical protein
MEILKSVPGELFIVKHLPLVGLPRFLMFGSLVNNVLNE